MCPHAATLRQRERGSADVHSQSHGYATGRSGGGSSRGGESSWIALATGNYPYVHYVHMDRIPLLAEEYRYDAVKMHGGMQIGRSWHEKRPEWPEIGTESARPAVITGQTAAKAAYSFPNSRSTTQQPRTCGTSPAAKVVTSSWLF